MYRFNPPHHNLESCEGNCFDDLCRDRQAFIGWTYDESPPQPMIDPLDVNPFTANRQNFGGSTKDNSTDSSDSSDEEPTSELERKSQQIANQAKRIHADFMEFSKDLNGHEERLTQLCRQNSHCCNLLSAFEDFLQSFEEESSVNCDDWFTVLHVMELLVDDFDEESEQLLQRLSDKMERLFDFCEQEKNQLQNGPQTPENLDHLSMQLCFVASQIELAGEELDDLDDCLQIQVQQQRDLIGQFVDVMVSIVQAVQSSLVSNQIGEFDCFTGQHFLQEFNKTLNQIQII